MRFKLILVNRHQACNPTSSLYVFKDISIPGRGGIWPICSIPTRIRYLEPYLYMFECAPYLELSFKF